MKVYGPYTRKDGRQHVIIIYSDGSRRTVSYPKWIIEQELGRELDPDTETVDHIDGDFTNNDISNLRIIPRHTHAKEDAKYVELVELNCIWCGKSVTRKPKDIRRASKLGRTGPFCSKSCLGKYSRAIQLKEIYKLDPQEPIESVYYKIKKTI